MTLDPIFLLINKPAGWTSFDAVNFIRKKLRTEKPENKNIKVGHAGTLDPFATGLLIVGVGREATKRLDEFKALAKTYVATICLGATSDTDDSMGKITNHKFQIPTKSQITKPKTVILSEVKDPLKSASRDYSAVPQNDNIETTLRQFLGKQTQIPPMYSAKQVNGQRLYKLARAGKVVERQPCEIEIYAIKLLDYTWPNLKIEITCSAGTYIRTLARDIGERLGVGGYCAELTRTKIGNYSINQAVDINSKMCYNIVT